MKIDDKKYIIALDMDGTLLNSHDQIMPKTKEYLKELSLRGHKIIISSGRPLRGIKSYYDEIGLDTPIICYNGAYIFPGVENNFPEYAFSFPKEYILEMIKEIGYDKLENIILETNKDIYFLKNDGKLERFFSIEGMNAHIGKIEDTLQSDTMTMLIVVKDVISNNLVKEAVEKHQGIKLRFWSGHWFNVSEIYFENINKGNALKDLAKFYDIDNDHIIAFGDACNDIELLSLGNGIAMLNAEDELKAIAKDITEFDNNNEGIYHHLKKLFN